MSTVEEAGGLQSSKSFVLGQLRLHFAFKDFTKQLLGRENPVSPLAITS